MFGLDLISVIVGILIGWLLIPMALGFIAKKKA